MTFEADLRAHLLGDSTIAQDLADQAANESRFWWNARPKGQTILPAVVATVISGQPQAQTLDEDDDSDAAGGCENVRLQLDVYAADYDQATALGRLVIARMAKISSDKSIRATRLSRASAGPDPETREPREILEFSVWHSPQ